jgi:hypothetical protein
MPHNTNVLLRFQNFLDFIESTFVKQFCCLIHSPDNTFGFLLKPLHKIYNLPFSVLPALFNLPSISRGLQIEMTTFLHFKFLLFGNPINFVSTVFL